MAAREGGRPTARHRFHRRFQHPLQLLVFVVWGALPAGNPVSRFAYSRSFPILLMVFAYILISIYENARVRKAVEAGCEDHVQARLHVIPGAGPGRGLLLKNIIAGVGSLLVLRLGCTSMSPASGTSLSPSCGLRGLCLINMVTIDHWETSARKAGERQDGRRAETERFSASPTPGFFLP